MSADLLRLLAPVCLACSHDRSQSLDLADLRGELLRELVDHAGGGIQVILLQLLFCKLGSLKTVVWVVWIVLRIYLRKGLLRSCTCCWTRAALALRAVRRFRRRR